MGFLLPGLWQVKKQYAYLYFLVRYTHCSTIPRMQGTPVVLAGDRFQQLYAFNHACGAMTERV